MSWFEACKIYKERTGKWVVPKNGSKEHNEISKLYHELKYPNCVVACEESETKEPKKRGRPRLMKPERQLAMIPTNNNVERAATEEELEAERCRIARIEEEKRYIEAMKLEKDIQARQAIEKDYNDMLERRRLVDEVRKMAPKTQSTKTYCRKTGNFKVSSGKIISFD